jgi:hypothetical protein
VVDRFVHHQKHGELNPVITGALPVNTENPRVFTLSFASPCKWIYDPIEFVSTSIFRAFLAKRGLRYSSPLNQRVDGSSPSGGNKNTANNAEK